MKKLREDVLAWLQEAGPQAFDDIVRHFPGDSDATIGLALGYMWHEGFVESSTGKWAAVELKDALQEPAR